MGDPLVLTLLNLLARCVLTMWQAFAWIVWLPIQLLFVATYPSVARSKTREHWTGVGSYVIYLPLRWLAGTIFGPLVIVLWFLPWWTLSSGAATQGMFARISVAISVCSALTFGLSVGYRMHNPLGGLPVRSMRLFLRGVAYSQFEIGGLVCGLLTCCLLLRAPALFADLSSPTLTLASGKKRQRTIDDVLQACYAELLRSLLDWICVPFLLLLFLVGWRVPQCQRDARGVSYLAARQVLVSHAMAGVLDLPCFLLAVPVFLTVYRAPLVLATFRAPPLSAANPLSASWNDCRMVCLKAAGSVLVDVPFFALSVVVCGSLYRLDPFLKDVLKGVPEASPQSRAKATNYQWIEHLRVASVHHALSLVLDLLSVIALVVLGVTVYRFKHTWRLREQADRELRTRHSSLCTGQSASTLGRCRTPHTSITAEVRFGVQIACLRQIVEMMYDVPSFLLAMPVLLTLWGAANLLQDVRKAPLEGPDSVRSVCYRAFSDWLRDLPYILLYLLLVCSLIRTVPATLSLYRAFTFRPSPKAPPLSTRSRVHAHLLTQLHCLCLDIPCLFLFLLLIVTVYRLPIMYKLAIEKQRLRELEFRRLLAVYEGSPQPESAIQAVEQVRIAETARAEQAAKRLPSVPEYYSVVAGQAMEVVSDLPFLLLAVLLLALPWRAAVMYPLLKLGESSLSAIERRRTVAVYFRKGLLDLPCLVCGVWVVLTGWRLPRLIADLRKFPTVEAFTRAHHRSWVARSGPREAWQHITLTHGMAMLDPRELLCGPAVACSLWRLPALLRCLNSQRCRNDEDRRVAAYAHALLSILDVLCSVGGLVVFVTLWRAWTLAEAIQRHHAATSAAMAKRERGEVVASETLSDVRGVDEKTQVSASFAVDHRALRAHFTLHKIILVQLGLLIRDLPLIVLLGLGKVFFWRKAKPVSDEGLYSDQCSTAGSHVLCGLFDLVCAVLTACLCLTWRCPLVLRNLWNQENKAVTEQKTGQDAESTRGKSGGESPPTTQQPFQYLSDYHYFILNQSLECLLDVPFIILSPLTLWRVGGLFQVLLQPTLVPDGNKSTLVQAKVCVVCPSVKTLTGSGTLDGHGLVLRLHAQLRSSILQSLGVEQVRLSFNDEFFSSLSAVVPTALLRVFRMTMHPLALCPQLLDRMDLLREEAKCDLELGTGRRGGQKISHATILPALQKMAVAERRTHSEGGEVRLDFLTPGSIFNRKTGLLLRFRLSACALEEACANMDTEVPLVVIDSPAPPPAGVSAMQIRLMVFSQAMYALLDVVCVGLAAGLVVVPWRVHGLYRALVHGDDDRSQGKTDRGFHALVCSHFLRAIQMLPLEIMAICFCMCTPWRFRRLFSTLIRKDTVPLPLAVSTLRERVSALMKSRTRSDGLFVLCFRAVRDFLGLIVFLILTLSIWRFILFCSDLPSALKLGEVLPMPPFLDLKLPPAKLTKLKKKRKGRVVLMAGKHFGLLLLDLLQLMELLYIMLTLVGFPHYVRRVVAWRAYSRSVAPQYLRPSKKKISRSPDQRARSLLDVLPHHTLLFPFLDYKSLCACRQVTSEWPMADDDRYWIRLFLSRWPQGVVATQVVANFKALFKDKHQAELQQRNPPPQHELDYALGHRYLLHMEFLHALPLIRHFFLLPFKLFGVVLGFPVLCVSYVRYTWPRARLPTLLQCPMATDTMRWDVVKASLTFWKCHDLFALGGLHFGILLVNELAVVVAALNVAVLYVSTLGLPLLLKATPNSPILTTMINGLLGFSLPIYLAFNFYLLILPNLVWWTTWGPWTFQLFLPLFKSIFNFLLSVVCFPLAFIGLDSSLLTHTLAVLFEVDGKGATPLMGAHFEGGLDLLGWTLSVSVELLLSAMDFLLFLVGLDLSIDHSWSVVVGETVHRGGLWLASWLQLDRLLTIVFNACTLLLNQYIGVWQGAWKFADVQLAAGTTSASLLHLFPGVVVTPTTVQKYLGYFLLPFDGLLKFELILIKLLYLLPLPGVYYVVTIVHYFLTSKIVMQFAWFAVMGRAWFLFFAVQRQVVPNANPLWTYMLPFRFLRWQLRLGVKFLHRAVVVLVQTLKQLLNRMGGCYSKSLIVPTRICNRMGFLGDLLLIPVSLFWMGWPLWIPYRTKLAYLYIPAILATLACVVWGTNIIKRTWR